MSTDDFFKKELGNRVAKVRGTLTQKGFASKIGVSRSYVGNIEQGITMPSLEVLINICHQYQVSLDWLVFGVKLPKQQKSESTADPDLTEMTTVLKNLMENDNSDLRTWAKIQFQKAFGEYYANNKIP